MTYRTSSSNNAYSSGTSKVSISFDSNCTTNFLLYGKKYKGKEKIVCDISCPDGKLDNGVVKIQQSSKDGWGIEKLEIKDIFGTRYLYSLDEKSKMFWVDGDENGNYEGLPKCTNGKMCDLFKIGKKVVSIFLNCCLSTTISAVLVFHKAIIFQLPQISLWTLRQPHHLELASQINQISISRTNMVWNGSLDLQFSFLS